MTVNQSTQSFAQEDTVTINFPIYSTGTTPATLTAPTGNYAIALTPTSGTPLLSKNGTFSKDSITGLWTMTVSLTKAQTGLLPARHLWHQASVQDSDGSNESIFGGFLLVTPVIPQAAVIAGET